MADYITKVRTIDGDKQIDYNALANLPDLDQIQADIDNHVANKDNPHDVTTEQIGALSISGGAMEGALIVSGIILTEGVDYGPDDPNGGVIGQLYFKKVT